MNNLSAIVHELERTAHSVSPASIAQLTESILNANAVFVAGAGRSGLMLRAFAMRLVHMGFTAYVVGETITPAISTDDLLLIGSGSGETKSLTAMAAKAQTLSTSVAAITIVPDSTIARTASIIVQIPASTKENTDNAGPSVQPMGSLFEQSLLLVLDAIVLAIMDKKGLTAGKMFEKHANLE